MEHITPPRVAAFFFRVKVSKSIGKSTAKKLIKFTSSSITVLDRQSENDEKPAVFKDYTPEEIAQLKDELRKAGAIEVAVAELEAKVASSSEDRLSLPSTGGVGKATVSAAGVATADRPSFSIHLYSS